MENGKWKMQNALPPAVYRLLPAPAACSCRLPPAPVACLLFLARNALGEFTCKVLN